MSLVARFTEEIRDKQLFLPTQYLLLAVSGGVDSIVLCELCKQAGFHFAIAHVNFQLRGPESERDEAFVKAVAERYKVKLYLNRFDTANYASEHRISIQVAARELRYGWFAEILSGQIDPESTALQWLLTAHHAGDNVETMLLNLFRGTGISGIRGMLPKQDQLVRPLLEFGKEELLQFAFEQHLQWMEDSSNASDKYSRNYFRHTLIPLAASIYPEAEKNLRNNLVRFRETEMIYNQAIELRLKKLLVIKGNETHVPALLLKKSAPLNTIVYEIIKRFSFSSRQVGDAVHFLTADQGKYIESSTHRIIKNRNWLIIAPHRSGLTEHLLIEENTPQLIFDNYLLDISFSNVSAMPAHTDDREVFLDARMLMFPLMLRKWRPGDYFYPLGMKKKKKLGRFLIDKKTSPTDKDRVRVIESADKKIIWAVGLRMDDRFRITPGTKKVMRLIISVAECI